MHSGKRVKVLILVVVLLLNMSMPLNISYAGDMTGQLIANQIENMDKKYTQQDWNGTGSIKSADLWRTIDDRGSVFFENNDLIFDDLTVFYDKNTNDDYLSLKFENQRFIEIGGKKVIIGENQFDENTSYIYHAEWLLGDFHIVLLSTGFKNFDETGNVRELEAMVEMVDNALEKINQEDEIISNETAVVDEEELTLSISLEKDKLGTNEYEGITADGDSTISINISVSGDYNGSVIIMPLSYGEITNKDISGDIPLSGSLELIYKPFKYIKESDAKLIEKFIVTAIAKDGTEKKVTKELEILRTPVVLVHGFTGDETTWIKLSEYLGENGYDTLRKNYYYEDETGESIPAQSRALGLHIKELMGEYENKEIKTSKVDIVAHSMGGLISRYLISRIPEYENGTVRKLIMVGTPNHGCGDIDKMIGWLSAYSADQHRTAAEQLYSKSPFIIDLNKDEKNGGHLSKDVEYGIIYGTGSLFGDGVVTDTSAMLNGVTSVPFAGLTHSPAVSFLGPPLTENQGVFDQIKTWINEDIPPGMFNSIDMRIYSYEGEAYKSNPDYSGGDDFFISVSDTDDLSVSEYEDLKTEDGRMTVVLKAGNKQFGTVMLDKYTEMYFEYSSPHVMRVSISKGSAKFTSGQDSDNHFEVSLKSSNNLQVIRGLRTSFVVNTGDETSVICLEGGLSVVNGNSYDNTSIATLMTNQRAGLTQDAGIMQISDKDEKWWEDPFYNNTDTNDYLNRYKDYIIYVIIVVVLLFIIILFISRRKRNK